MRNEPARKFADSHPRCVQRRPGERAARAVTRGTDALVWITWHTFRKTAATILDEAALSARLVADQLGHSRPSMTQDVYMGRRAVDSQAALALEVASGTRPGAAKRVAKVWAKRKVRHREGV